MVIKKTFKSTGWSCLQIKSCSHQCCCFSLSSAFAVICQTRVAQLAERKHEEDAYFHMKMVFSRQLHIMTENGCVYPVNGMIIQWDWNEEGPLITE